MNAMRQHPVLVRLSSVVLACAVVALLWDAGLVATVRPLRQVATSGAIVQAGGGFNAEHFVDDIWKTRVLPTVTKDSVSLGTLLAAIASDPAAAAKQYGHEAGGVPNYLVRFTGKVTEVDVSSPIGVVTASVQTDHGAIPVKIDVGPVLLGTALRDAMPFISFQDFLNQVQYGDVADALNTKAQIAVIGSLDPKTLQGKIISVSGAMSYDPSDPSDLSVTPVVLAVGAASPP